MEALLVLPRVAMSLMLDAANGGVEICTLGLRPWWWRMRWDALRLYPGGGISIWLREAHHQAQPMAQLSFGETPVPCFLHMMRQIGATPDDLMVDLGCGRGLHLLAAVRVFGLRARGVDLLPGFISRGRTLAHGAAVEFVQGDIESADLTGATIVYIASTAFEPQVRAALAHRLLQLPPGTRIVTHDWALTGPRLLEERRYPLSWGWVDVRFYAL
ncbi:MAG TPA: class I SAM-dependent methyltransferase [Candidatus Xenobia bacterium]|jgi:SAM-dependent methyltransferase